MLPFAFIYLALPIIALETGLMVYVFLLNPGGRRNRLFALYMLVLAVSNGGGLIQGTANSHPAALAGAWAQAAATLVAGPLLWLVIVAVFYPDWLRRRRLVLPLLASIALFVLLLAADLIAGTGIVFSYPPELYTGQYESLRRFLGGPLGPALYALNLLALSVGAVLPLLWFALRSRREERLRRTAWLLIGGLVLAGAAAGFAGRRSPAIAGMTGPLFTAVLGAVAISRYRVFSPLSAAMREAVDSADVGLLVFDRLGQLLDANAAAAGLLGVDGPGGIPLALPGVLERLSHLAPEARPALQALGAQAATSPPAGRLQLQAWIPDDEPGLPRHLALRLRPVSDPYGERIGTLCSLEDLTAERRAQARITQANRELQAASEVLNRLNAAANPQESLPFVFGQLREISNCQLVALATLSDDLARLHFVVGLPPIPADAAAWSLDETAAAESLLAGRLHWTGDLRLAERFPLEAHWLASGLRTCLTLPLQTQQALVGALMLGWAELADDRADPESGYRESQLPLLRQIADAISLAIERGRLLETLEEQVAARTRELSAAYERLQALDRLKSKFMADVSHELRVPVTNLGLYLNLLKHAGPAKGASYLPALDQHLARLRGLLDSILTLTRLELDGETAAFAPVDLNALVSGIVEAERPRAEAAGLELSFNADEDLPAVCGHADHLELAIEHLLANAIQYTDEGFVRVSTYRSDANAPICLQISDSGMGMTGEDLTHLFERFYRGQRTGQMTVPGFGLGLALVKRIVDRHHGEIDVESALDGGSTFRVCLPAAE